VLLEARAQAGGRIASPPGGQGPARFDLGPTWFWPDLQPGLDALVHALGLERLEPSAAGDMVLERSPREAPLRVHGLAESTPSVRLAGGMGALVDALLRELPHDRILAGQSVRRMRSTGAHVEVQALDGEGRTTAWQVAQVLLAVPPRLAQASIDFMPPLPASLARQWQATPTWMAPHAKYLAVYDSPFWRRQGLSGQARSAIGPLGEIHDASLPGAGAALFGFFGVPASVRAGVSQEKLLADCRAQLSRLFGEPAGTPRAEFIKDWARDPLTASAADLKGAGQHASPPAAKAADGPWSGLLEGIASEWSPQFPGYLAGALEAAERGVAHLAGMFLTLGSQG
jgi:monoamine oxidase